MKRSLATLAAVTMVAVPALNAQDANPIGSQAGSVSQGGQAFNPAQALGAARFIELTELGYANGIEMQGMSGTTDLYFPLPPAGNIASVRLQLPYRSDTAFESRRSLVVEAGGRTLYTASLPSTASQGMIDIPVDPALVRDGFLHVRVLYSGAITEDRCIDQRLSGAFLAVPESAGLLVEYTPRAFSSVGSFAQLMPPGVTITLPASPSPAQAAAALTLAAGNPAASIGSALPLSPDNVWRSTNIAIGGPQEPALQLVRMGSSPQLRLGGQDPAATARLLLSNWKALSAAPVIGTALLENSGQTPDRLTFSDLSGDTSIRSVVSRGTWTVPLLARDLPAGQQAQRLVVEATVSQDGGKTLPVVTVMMNGVLLDSAQVTDPQMTRLDMALPEGLASTQNIVELAVTRQVASGDCMYAPQGYDAQILPSSHFLLGQADDAQDFSDLAAAFNGGYSVVTQDASLLASLARILEPLTSHWAPVQVSYSDMPASGPVVVVSDTAPEGTSPRLRFDQGQVELAVNGGRTLLDATALARTTIVQLLDNGDGPVLWVKPGEDFADLATSAQPMVLGHGDIAVLTGDRIELAFSTSRDRLVDIRYPQQTSLAQLLNRYRLWLIGFGWALISLGFIYLLRRIYLARRAD